MVPEGWVKYSGSAITCRITKGSSPKWQGFEYQDHGTLFVTSENVRDGYLDVSTPKYLSVEFNQKLKNSQLQHGDILINIVGASIGRSCQFLLGTQQANINQAVCLFRTNELALSDYVKHFLQLPSTVRKLLGTQSESARPNLSLADMKDFIFVLPPLPEQKKIAQILYSWDKAITTTEQLLGNSQQQKKALMQQLLTGKKRLLDENGVRFSGEWAEVKLSDLCLKITDGAHNSPPSVLEGYPIYSVKDMTSSGFSNDDVRIIGVSEYQLLSKQGCKPAKGDVLIAKDGSVLKHCFVVDVDLEAVVLSSIAILKPNPDLIVSDFLAQYFSQEHFKFFVKKALTSGSGVPRIVLKDFKGIFFKVPSISEQLKIVSVLAVADHEISALQQKLDALKQEKKALMQQLLTGKRRVKTN
jgi:type I restriction enzyme S subunit